MMLPVLGSDFKRLKSRGFTLIELLVVISIIGILTVLVAANLNSARSRARDAQRKSDLKNISTALRLYYNDNGEYPAASLDFGSPDPWTSTDGSTIYMSKVPQDPLNQSDGTTYTYIRGLGDPDVKDTFSLTACLENPSDKQGVDVTPGFGCDTGGKMFQIVQQ